MHESELQTWQGGGTCKDPCAFQMLEPRKEEGIEEIAGKIRLGKRGEI